MKIVKATQNYERWLAEHVAVVASDLAQKHANMASDPFIFLRATFYRWAQRFPIVCPELYKLPDVLAINDLHIENFGTWRDSEGRLVWGVNDFDEAFPNCFAIDLVRLATSAFFAIKDGNLAISRNRACKALLSGYEKSLKTGGSPFVLQEGHPELRAMAISRLKEPFAYWTKINNQMKAPLVVPASAKKALSNMFPEKGLKYISFHRQSGQGSLGRQRLVAVMDYKGGKIAREVKALVPSACYFASAQSGKKVDSDVDRAVDRQLEVDRGIDYKVDSHRAVNRDVDYKFYYNDLINTAVRCPDPFVSVTTEWIGRRLAPDCSRIELSALPRNRDEQLLLQAMGYETGNIHLASQQAIPQILDSLERLSDSWLLNAARAMFDDTLNDFKIWRQHLAKIRDHRARIFIFGG
jgi:hypothetical protein